MNVIILAGGLGTRLRSVVSDLPKPMAPVHGKPFVQHLISWLLKFPVSKIIFSVGFKKEIIMEYFGEEYQGIPVVYAVEEEPLGTGGAIANGLKYADEDFVLVVNGDTYFPIDLNWFYVFHTENESGISIALKSMQKFDRYGSVELTGNDITAFKEKTYLDEGLINGGIYFLEKEYFLSKSLDTKFSFETEILEKAVLNQNIKGSVFNEAFIDIGIAEDYYKASEIL